MAYGLTQDEINLELSVTADQQVRISFTCARCSTPQHVDRPIHAFLGGDDDGWITCQNEARCGKGNFGFYLTGISFSNGSYQGESDVSLNTNVAAELPVR